MRSINQSSTDYAKWLAGQLEGFGGLDLAVLGMKYERMRKEKPHTFLRATFYRWAERWREMENGTPVVLSVGDVHVENFGTWRGKDGKLVWGINDADDACRLPWTSDVVRLGVSVCLALGDNAVAEAVPETACDSVLAGYAAAMAAMAAPGAALVTEGHGVYRLVKEIILDETLEDFWQDEDAKKQPAQNIPGSAVAVLTPALPVTDAGLVFLEPKPAEPPGTGSMGKRRYYAAASIKGERLMREAKPAVPSGLAWAGGTSDDGSTAALLASTHRVPDPTQQLDRGWIVRGLSRDAGKMKFKKLAEKKASPEELECLLQSMGRELAGLHRSGGDDNLRAAILTDLETRATDGAWLRKLVAEQSALVKQDRAEFTLTIPPLPVAGEVQPMPAPSP